MKNPDGDKDVYSPYLSLNSGKVGIYGFGALVVTLYKLLNGDCIIGKVNSHTTQDFRMDPVLRLMMHNKDHVEEEDITGNFFRDLADSATNGGLPEVVIVAPNPDQLMDFIRDLVDYIEFLVRKTAFMAGKMVPAFVIASNGIFDGEFREWLCTALDSSVILNGLSLKIKREITGRIIRMTAYQAGKREGTGSKAVYEVMPKGNVVIAGGKATVRERVKAIFIERGYPDIEDAGESAERVEFIKAIYNLMANAALLAFIAGEEGEARHLVTGSILPYSKFCIKDVSDFAHKVGETTFNIGKRRRLFPEEERFNYILERHIYPVLKKYETVPHSSLQLFHQKLREGKLGERLLPLEENLISTLVDIAEREMMLEEKEVLLQLKTMILDCFRRANHHGPG